MLINVSQGEECRIALVEDGKLEELYMERSSATSHVGNIYKGRVTNVEASIQAAFIDFGLGRNGFLHISDLMPNYFGHGGSDIQESVGRKLARRDRPPIQRCLRRGDEIIVQIIKEGIGTKGPTLSTYLSIPGRIIVMMPGMARMGVSKKIEDDVERRRLRQILDSLKPPKDVGFIIRTAGIGKSKAEIQRDLTYLTRLWMTFVKKRDSGPGPLELYTEGDLVTRTVRDVFTTDIDKIVVDDKEVAKRVKEVIKLANPRTKNKVDLYEEPVPIFHKYGIEREIELMYSRHVPLPSGGSLVIDSTEAVVAIDVNSGKFRDHSDAETTAFKTDMEAADEIPRQLRLRDLGGVIICDFIDLRYERHRRELEGRLHANFQKDRAKTKVLRMSQFGIIELTRQRMRPSLKRSIYFDCLHCKGAGLVKTPESMSLDVMRRLAIVGNDARVSRIELTVSPEVTFYLQNRKRAQISQLELTSGKQVIIRTDPHIATDDMRLALFDAREGNIYLQELGMTPAIDAPIRTGRGGRPQGRFDQQRGGRQQFNRGRGGAPSLPPPRRPQSQEEDHYDIDNVEDQVDRREHDQEDDESQQPISETGDNAPETDNEIVPNKPMPVGSPQDLPGDQQGGGGRRRRRGRRGGRGRNRGGYKQEFDQGPQAQEQAVGEGVSELEVSEEETEITEIDQDSAPQVLSIPSAQPPAAGNFNDEDRPHRRRRRGRRGRGRGTNSDQTPISNGAKPPIQSAQQPPLENQVEEDDGPSPGNSIYDADPNVAAPRDRGGAPRRRGRGGRGRGGRSGNDAPQSPRLPPPPKHAPASHANTNVSQRDREPVRPRNEVPRNETARDDVPRAAEAPTLTRTGSADRHLINDEPVAPQPVSRPRTYRDLDSIPDDFD
jgi:ribonuclease E